MPVLLKSGQSASREEAVEEMKDCRSMKQNWLGEKRGTPSMSSWNSIATATRQKEFDDMLDKMIKGQEKELMSSFSQMLGIVYTEPNEESETMNAQIEKSDIEVQWTDEFARREEADISDTTSTSTDGTTSTSTDSRTSTSTYGTTSTSTDGKTSTSTDGTTSTSTDGTTSMSIDSTTSTSTNGTTSMSIDDIEKEITMEDFLDLEEFLELELEELLELEEWLEDMDQISKKKLDDDQNTSRRDLETSPKASIGRHQPDEIDRHPPCIIEQHPPSIIVRHLPDSIDLHPPQSIDRHPLLDELHIFIVETEPIEERMHESEASHNADTKYLGPLICVEESAGLHKRVKRIHDPVKIVVPCAVVEVEFPIPPDRIDKGPAEAASVDTDRIPSNDTNKPTSIDITTSPSIDTGRISEQKEFDAPIETSIDAF
ncbi:hypothetical protein F2Q68_00025240 [Brassica cretica]|uniref:Uncharacterized protein n=1 Tax=Brassica cretica TaxID=69181 RepID=A0A8S9IH36_BRACR|nr:hypothetical protein F2Q68_00025240 [Brassica cretica]